MVKNISKIIFKSSKEFVWKYQRKRKIINIINQVKFQSIAKDALDKEFKSNAFFQNIVENEFSNVAKSQ